MDNISGRIQAQDPGPSFVSHFQSRPVGYIVAPLIFPVDRLSQFLEAEFASVIAIQLILVAPFNLFESQHDRTIA